MTLAQAHILLVEDEAILRMTLSLLLRRQGAQVTEAANGTEALQFLRQEPVDLLLLDRHMPFMDGPALLEMLAGEGRTVPTVLCAGTLGDGPPADLARYGVRATLLKPFSPAVLFSTLEAVLNQLP